MRVCKLMMVLLLGSGLMFCTLTLKENQFRPLPFSVVETAIKDNTLFLWGMKAKYDDVMGAKSVSLLEKWEANTTKIDLNEQESVRLIKDKDHMFTIVMDDMCIAVNRTYQAMRKKVAGASDFFCVSDSYGRLFAIAVGDEINSLISDAVSLRQEKSYINATLPHYVVEPESSQA